MKRKLNILLTSMFILGLAACGGEKKSKTPSTSSPYAADVTFLKKYSEVIELTDSRKKSRIAVMPGLQARVMTSSAGPPENLSYGWINRAAFESGDTSAHMNAYGGEERFWMGPEGGQFSIFFKKDSAFSFQHWHTPPVIDLEAYDLVSKTNQSANFTKSSELTNYWGTVFQIQISRGIKVLDTDEIFQKLGIPIDTSLISVAFQTTNKIENKGKAAWSKKTGLLSIWLLGMFNPSTDLTMAIPFNEGPVETLGPIVNDDYFGKVPGDRLKIGKGIIFFKGDGTYRSKIGFNPLRAKNILASYDAATKTLTIVQYSKGTGDYVNSKWEIQAQPFKGDAINAYNDGPPAPGVKPMGPFYELESSSPARELKPGEEIVHSQTTFHFQGEHTALNNLTVQLMGISLDEIASAFK